MKEKIKEFLSPFLFLFVLGLFFPMGIMATDLTPVFSPESKVQVQSEHGFAVFDGKCYFVGYTITNDEQLFQYDGVHPPQIAPNIPKNCGIYGFITFNHFLYISSKDGIFAYDGNNRPTLISPGTTPQTFVQYKGKLFFTAADTSHGQELWMCDGVHPATLVQDIQKGPENSTPSNFCVYNGKLYFSATTTNTGTELFVYDGIHPAKLEVDVFPGSSSSYPQNIKAFEGKLYFWSGQKNNSQLWSYDFVNPPDQLAHTAAQSAGDLVIFDDQLYYFYMNNVSGPELRAFDGINTPLVANSAQQNPNQKKAGPFTQLGKKLFFGIQDNTGSLQLWSCDTNNAVTLAGEVPYTNTTENNAISTIFNMNGAVYVATENELYRYTSDTLTLTSPNGGEQWNSGSTQTISWTAPESVTEVTIVYSLDSGETWNTIAEWIPNSGSYQWTIPAQYSSLCLIRIYDPLQTYMDSSDNVFSIVNPITITITSPTGGETYTCYNPLTVSWSYVGNVTYEQVAIEISLDNGSTWNPVYSNNGNVVPLNSGQLDIYLPDTPSQNCLIRIMEPYSNISATSGVFTLEAPKWLYLPESTNTIYLEGNTYPIQWYWSGNISTVKLEYSYDGKNTWHLITAATPNTGTYNWTVPDIPTTPARQCAFRISDPLGTSTYETSQDYYFIILGPEDRIPLSERNALIALFNSTNGDNWNNKYNWRSLTNPNEFNDHGTEASWNGVTLSDDFKHVTRLNLYENNLTGSIADLSPFTQINTIYLDNNLLTGSIPNVNNLSNLTQFSLYNNALTGTIPNFIGLNNLEYINFGKNNLSGSIPNFSNTPLLSVICLQYNQLSGPIPNFNNLTLLDSLYIHHNQLSGPIPTFNSGTHLYRLEFHNNQLTGTIPDLSMFPNLSYISVNANQLSGIIPDSLMQLTNLMNNGGLNLTWNALYTANSSLYNFITSKSSSPWEITQTKAPSGLTITNVASDLRLSWNAVPNQAQAGGYQVFCSTTSGSGYQLLATINGKSQNSYTTTGLTVGTTYYFVVKTFTNPHTNNSNTVYSDYSTQVSGTSITPKSITITSPNGGESWEANTIKKITWTYTGTISNVKIDYSLNGGTSWTSIVSNAINNGYYNILIPNSPGSSCIIKVSDISGPTTDTSDAPFTIETYRTITVLAPNGNETYKVDTPNTITWNYTGTIPNVKLEYSTNNGTSWDIITAATPNTGSYNWTIPNTPSTTCKIKITDALGTAYDTSNNTFTIAILQIPTSERETLIALYNSTNGDNWTNKTNWRKPGDPTQFNDPGTEHTWYGITLNALKSNVSAINLSANNMVGTLPDLNNLTALTSIDLSSNQISGSLENKLHLLSQLKTLSLYSTQFSGNFPNINNLSQLETLGFYNNQFSGPIPTWLNTLTSLKYINLARNAFTGTIPNLSNLTNMKSLDLSENQLADAFPTWINSMTQLTNLRLYSCHLTGTFPDLSNLYWLMELDLSDNQLTGPIPDLSYLHSITQLGLNQNQFTGSIPNSLTTMTTLYYIGLNYNQLTGTIPNFSNLTHLTTLYLAYNHLTGPIPSDIGNLSNLRYLSLNGNNLRGEIPSSITQLTLFTPGSGLNLGYNCLSSTDSTVRSYLDTYHYIAPYSTINWEKSQTVPPTALAVSTTTDTTLTLTWQRQAFFYVLGGFKIYYTTTPGTNYTLAETTTNKSDNTYTITGLQPNTTYYVIVKAYTLANNDNPNEITSDASVEVSGTTQINKSITITAPNGGETPEVGTTLPITWTHTGAIANVKLEYSTNNGTAWTTIIASTANTGSYNWTVPNDVSSQCLVKITDVAGSATDSSNAVFSILTARALTLTTPNGGENLEVGTTLPITWTHTGAIANVKLEYSTNNGTAWTTISASTANTGSYNWTVPNNVSSQCLVKITDAAGTATDSSNAVFSILTARALTLTAPNGGENLEVGTVQPITWTHTGAITNVKLEYSINNGSTWTTISASTTNSGSYNWTVPNTPATTCLLKITDAAGTTTDSSNAVFSILTARTLTLTTPNGGENLEVGTVQSITWTHTGAIANVKLEYSINNGTSWTTIIASTTNSGSYNWTVPNTPATTCLLKITDAAGTTTDSSNAVFSILTARTLTLTSPNGGENLEVGTVQPITWTFTGAITNVKLEYSINNGSTWATISASTANSGSYNWTVPNTPATTCLLKITDAAGTATDSSNAVFSILTARALTLTSPNGGQSWTEGTTQSITWTSTGAITNVALSYSTNNGSSWNTIQSSIANTGSYSWVIPGVDSTTCLVKVTDTTSSATDSSNAVFTLWRLPSLTVTSPNGAESWKQKTTHAITWTSTGNISTVKLQYTLNGGTSWTTITTSTTNSGSYSWLLPSVTSNKTTCKVKITANGVTATDSSNANFTILK